MENSELMGQKITRRPYPMFPTTRFHIGRLADSTLAARHAFKASAIMRGRGNVCRVAARHGSEPAAPVTRITVHGPFFHLHPSVTQASSAMLTTENEATKIGCPLLTLAFGRYQGSFREADGVCCHGSHCMLWRWESARPSPNTLRKGFCGLGSKPLDLPGTCEWA
jgi:hypothetical protein